MTHGVNKGPKLFFEGGQSIISNFSVEHLFMKWWPYFDFFIMANTDIPFLLTLRKPETQTLGGVGNLKFFCTMHIYEMAAIFLSPHHFIFGSVSTFKYDNVPLMCGHSRMMTFLDIKVHNGCFKFSVGSDFLNFPLVSFPHHIRFTFHI